MSGVLFTALPVGGALVGEVAPVAFFVGFLAYLIVAELTRAAV